MATEGHNLSSYNKDDVPNAYDYKFGIVVSEWNKNITESLYRGTLNTLLKQGAKESNITRWDVPGSFELVFGAKKMLENISVDAIIVIGSVIQGETRHFDFVCEATAQGIKDLNMKYDTPIIFCVLTDYNLQQAIDRSGGKYGNKGIEAAIAAIKMITLG